MNTTIAIDLGGTNVRVARVREGKIEARLSEPVKASGTERGVLDQMCALVEKVNNGTASRIGVAVPSVVDFNTGIVYNVMNIPSWKEVHLKQYLESRFGIETHADNDVNCFVAAEKAYGAGRPFDNLVGITLGTGVGAGIVIDGRCIAVPTRARVRYAVCPILRATMKTTPASNSSTSGTPRLWPRPIKPARAPPWP